MFGDNTLGIRASGSAFTIQTASGIDAISVSDNGRLGARQSVATQALGLSSPVASGQSCSGASNEVSNILSSRLALEQEAAASCFGQKR